MFDEIVDIIRKHSEVYIFTHNSMDGDTLGSALALSFALEKAGKPAFVVVEEKIPRNLGILPSSNFLRDISSFKGDFEASGKLAVVLDVADPIMLGKRTSFFKKFGLSINIDHHPTNKRFCGVNFVEPEFAATSEMVYYVVKELGVDLDKQIAECLYAGICTDTGGFRYKNTTSRTHIIAAELLKHDLDVDYMHFSFFEANTSSKIKISGYVSYAMNFYYEGKLAIAVIPFEVFQKYRASDEDTDGLVNIGRSVIGVEISILAREIRKGYFKVNFRSTRGADVSAVAAGFGGGGHKAAAGCTLSLEEKDVEAALVKSVEKIFSLSGM